MNINPNTMMAETDSRSIQNAVDEAVRLGINEVVIPRINERTGEPVWIIDETVKLPSNFTLVLDNCHLRLADGVYCNMFTNSLARTEEGLRVEQSGIRIIGRGNALLDGGVHNGLDEYTQLKGGRPAVNYNVMIYLHNVCDFTLEGFTVTDQRYWAIALMYASRGRVANLSFRLTGHEKNTYQPWHFQDGVDLRIGCNNILIENIEGEIGDDLVALTALSESRLETQERVENKSRDIHDIIIRDIRGISNMCSIIRLLCHYGQKLYNVSISNVFDVSRPGLDARAQMVFRIGDDCWDYYKRDYNKRVRLGEISNITIDGVWSRGISAVNVSTCVKNLTVRNVHVHSDGGYAVLFGYAVVNKVFIYHPSRREEYDEIRTVFRDSEMRTPESIEKLSESHKTELENVLVENVFYDTENGYSDAVIGVWNTCGKNVAVKNICNSTNLPSFKYYDDESLKIK